MSRRSVDRLTEGLAALCMAAAVVTLVLSARAPAVEGALAQFRVQKVSGQDLDRFQALLREARRQVDANGDPDRVLSELQEGFPGRHEVWALTARLLESRGLEPGALRAYARAVRLQPDYLDKNSSLYLGRRIENMTQKVLGELIILKDQGQLDGEGRDLLKTAYFLKRRLAGGCE